MKYAVKPRKDINFRTIFNIIGPLCNPAGVKYQLLGVFSPDLTEKIAKVLAKLGVKRAWVVHSQDGMDEISPFAPTKVSSVEESGEVATFYIHPEELGFKGGNCEELRGGSKEENVAIANSIIEGRDKSSRYSAVLINAAAAFYIAGRVKDLKEGVNLAETLINTGEVKKLLDKIRSFH
jgi:anthranilate phosphoribosyltransferase